MKLVLEIVKCQNGIYDQKRPYTVLVGRTDNSKWIKAFAWDQVGTKLLEKIEGLLQPDEDVAARRIMVDCEGYWSARTKEHKDKPATVEHKFIIKTFTILNGPSLEAARMRLDAGVALAEAEKNRQNDDLLSAYRMLESYVASIARCPAPSQTIDAPTEEVEDAPDEISADGPEEAAQRRFREADAARGAGSPEAVDQAVPVVKPDAEPVQSLSEPEGLADANAAIESSAAPVDTVSKGDAPEQLDTAADHTALVDEDADQTFGNEDGEPAAAAEVSVEATVPTDEPKVAAPVERPLMARRPPPPRRLPAASPAPGM
ncbi:hypothetical protein [Bosea sp. RAC05]|uniref:hypothetical protein n=1 Tax=Bosea sp. RAC05 TaxID=1842539 RepID=UPI00083D1C2A|nr:hypothetical protein [Bosea sp. RAC05]AOG02784.1 hypothetical protein BSY19_5093 [Bosea sp. RAC05]